MPPPAEPIRTQRSARRYEHWTLLGLALLGLAAVVVLGAFVDPDPRGYGTHERLGMDPCRMLQWTGVPCPGCGVTTSVSLAAQGEFAASLRNQPFGFLLAFLVPLAAVLALVQHARGRDLASDLAAMRWRWWLLVLGFAASAGWIWKLASLRGWLG